MDKAIREIDSGTSPLRKQSAATVPVNGQRLQTLRQSAGMTQEELAQKAGYSDRLVRKAEASSPLRRSTVADLADALCTATQKVTADDLAFSREQISTDVAAFLLHGPRGSGVVLADLIHPRLALTVAGYELNIPFAGTHSGPAACESFRTLFLASFVNIEYRPEQTQCFANELGTCVQAITLLESSSKSPANASTMEIWWFLKTRFDTSQLISIELLYDTGNVCRLLG
jgi:transcriptional regulator with XRE-family HTH domain